MGRGGQTLGVGAGHRRPLSRHRANAVSRATLPIRVTQWAALGGATTSVAAVLLFFVLDARYPLPNVDPSSLYAKVVVARDGSPLRAFADPSGIWRYPVAMDEVSDNYLDALIQYEDRWYWRHPGVNPLALGRAAWQNLRHHRVVSGGSTLTMQVARLIDPHSRTLGGKAWQIFRALQLEWHYDKAAILTMYLNRAPFGGPLEGVQAAAFAYLGKSAAQLSDAEAALLVVLPQAPSRNRPDRFPLRAEQARNKVLGRLARRGHWSPQRVEDAKRETVWAQFQSQPMTAPLASRRLIGTAGQTRVLRTTIDIELQQGIAEHIRNRAASLPASTSIAVLVMENRTLAIRAYLGSADFADDTRFGHVDMVDAVRSPGSTLKPFLYGMALDAGLIHSQSLLSDAPSGFGDYRPENFSEGYGGPVSVTDALQRSLNVPAIQVLDRLGTHAFLARLRHAGIHIKLPAGATSNLALGLGGAGTTLEALVGAYSALANGGLAGRPRLLADEPVRQRRLLSAGAAWIVRQMLMDNHRPDQPAAHLMQYHDRPLAWKTGTSFGFRDSWTLGVTGDYTLGVWLGRPDGTPLPGFYGGRSAAPILFTLVDALARSPYTAAPDGPPPSVTQATVCWPLGGLADLTPEAHCHQRKTAYLLDGQVPPTLAETGDANPVSLWINPATGHRVDARCGVASQEKRDVALWPKTVDPWLPGNYKRSRLIPPYDTACSQPPALATGALAIVGLQDGSIIKALDTPPTLALHALGGQGMHHWFINGELRYTLPGTAVQPHEIRQQGPLRVTVVDEVGRSAEVNLKVVPWLP